MSISTYRQMTPAQVNAAFSFLEPSLFERFVIRTAPPHAGQLLLVDPITIVEVIVAIGSYLDEQYKQYSTEKWKEDVTTRLIRIEEQLNTLTNLVNDLFDFVPTALALNSVFEQNAFLSNHRSMLENIMATASKYDNRGWPIATKEELLTVGAAQTAATNAAAICMRVDRFGFTPFISTYDAAMLETTAMLVSGIDRKTVASRFTNYIDYFEHALSGEPNSLPSIRNGLKVLVTIKAQPMDSYPKYGSIGTSKPGVMDPDYVQDSSPPTVPRTAWSLLQIGGDKDTGFVVGAINHTFEWQTRDKILPEYPPITFGRETWDVERATFVINYLNSFRPEYNEVKQKFEGADLQVALAQRMLEQLKILQKTLQN